MHKYFLTRRETPAHAFPLNPRTEILVNYTSTFAKLCDSYNTVKLHCSNSKNKRSWTLHLNKQIRVGTLQRLNST